MKTVVLISSSQEVKFKRSSTWRKKIEHSIFRIRILLASPGNLSEDREKIAEIVRYINLDNGQREGFVAEIVSWETHSRPGAGEYPQAVINDQFPDDIDIFIGLMGTYFGTPTKHWGSGTEEEFRIAYDRWEKTKKPEIMFYFSDAMTSLSQIDPEQLAKRNLFRKEIEKLGIYYFVYSNIVEFQFDLHNHISSAIHAALKGKEIGRSEEAIPDESASTLKNFNELLATDALVNAIFLLDKGTTHLKVYTSLIFALNSDIGKITKVLVRESRNISRATQNGKQQKIEKSINAIYDEMNSYSKKVSIKIPKLSSEFSSSILSMLRTVQIVQDNQLEDSLSLSGVKSNIGEARDGLKSFIAAVASAEEGFAEWPDGILDLKIQKQLVTALHQDLHSSLSRSLELLDKLRNKIS